METSASIGVDRRFQTLKLELQTGPEKRIRL